MDKDTRDGCAIGCGLLIGLLFVDYLTVVGLIALICWCFSGFGLYFDIRIATGTWLIIHLIVFIVNHMKSK